MSLKRQRVHEGRSLLEAFGGLLRQSTSRAMERLRLQLYGRPSGARTNYNNNYNNNSSSSSRAVQPIDRIIILFCLHYFSISDIAPPHHFLILAQNLITRCEERVRRASKSFFDPPSTAATAAAAAGGTVGSLAQFCETLVEENAAAQVEHALEEMEAFIKMRERIGEYIVEYGVGSEGEDEDEDEDDGMTEGRDGAGRGHTGAFATTADAVLSNSARQRRLQERLYGGVDDGEEDGEEDRDLDQHRGTYDLDESQRCADLLARVYQQLELFIHIRGFLHALSSDAAMRSSPAAAGQRRAGPLQPSSSSVPTFPPRYEQELLLLLIRGAGGKDPRQQGHHHHHHNTNTTNTKETSKEPPSAASTATVTEIKREREDDESVVEAEALTGRSVLGPTPTPAAPPSWAVGVKKEEQSDGAEGGGGAAAAEIENIVPTTHQDSSSSSSSDDDDDNEEEEEESAAAARAKVKTEAVEAAAAETNTTKEEKREGGGHTAARLAQRQRMQAKAREQALRRATATALLGDLLVLSHVPTAAADSPPPIKFSSAALHKIRGVNPAYYKLLHARMSIMVARQQLHHFAREHTLPAPRLTSDQERVIAQENEAMEQQHAALLHRMQQEQLYGRAVGGVAANYVPDESYYQRMLAAAYATGTADALSGDYLPARQEEDQDGDGPAPPPPQPADGGAGSPRHGAALGEDEELFTGEIMDYYLRQRAVAKIQDEAARQQLEEDKNNRNTHNPRQRRSNTTTNGNLGDGAAAAADAPTELIKPDRVCKVKMGFTWTRYNRTHYDSRTNPPPKTVMWYEFTLFYPLLANTRRDPSKFFRIEPTPNGKTDPYCVLVFSVGPPYADVAYRIERKQWDPRRGGVRMSFDENGKFRLFFRFSNSNYRD